MIKPPSPGHALRTDLARESNERVVEILVQWGLVCVGVLALLAAGLGVVAANRDAQHQSEEFRSLASALVESNASPEDRQRILLSYQNSRFEDDREGILSLLLVDEAGRIALSSRPSWLGRPLEPSLLNGSGARNPELLSIASCLERQSSDPSKCFVARQGHYLPWTKTLTVAHPFCVFDRRAGLKPRHYLLVVSFDPGTFTASLLAEVSLAVLASTLLVVVLVTLLGHQLQRGLLPNLRQFAETDGLTGLMNRSAFMDLAVQMLAQGQRQNLPYVLGVIDIDHFKAINDGHGHVCGDEVLQKLARVLEGSLRDNDLVTRLGGEEFAVLLQCTTARGETLMERLRNQVEVCRLSFEGRPLRATVSLGGACTEQLGYNLDYLYSAADSALYRAKREGRNRVHWANTRREPVARDGWSPGEAWRQTFQNARPGPVAGPAGNPVPGDGHGAVPSPITAPEPPRPQP